MCSGGIECQGVMRGSSIVLSTLSMITGVSDAAINQWSSLS